MVSSVAKGPPRLLLGSVRSKGLSGEGRHKVVSGRRGGTAGACALRGCAEAPRGRADLGAAKVHDGHEVWQRLQLQNALPADAGATCKRAAHVNGSETFMMLPYHHLQYTAIV